MDKTILLEWILKRKEGIHLAQNTDKRRALVKTVITIRGPKFAMNSVANCEIQASHEGLCSMILSR